MLKGAQNQNAEKSFNKVSVRSSESSWKHFGSETGRQDCLLSRLVALEVLGVRVVVSLLMRRNRVRLFVEMLHCFLRERFTFLQQ